MAPKARVQKRLYYKIGEACKALGIQPYVLRYWETEFPALSPSKSRSGQRVYSEKELEVIRRIKQLLYDEGYTIAGAKKKLEGELAAGTLGEAPGASSPGAATATQAAGAAAPAGGAGPAAVSGSVTGSGAAAAAGLGAASGAAASPSAPFVIQGPVAVAPAVAGVPAQAAPGAPAARAVSTTVAGADTGGGLARAGASPTGAAEGAGSGGAGAGGGSPGVTSARPVRAVPLPLLSPVPPANAPGLAASASPGAADREGGGLLPLESPPALAGTSGSLQKKAAPAGGVVSAGPRDAAGAKSPHGAVPEPEGDGESGGVAGAVAPSAVASQALDTEAAKQIETLRKGILKALEGAREILALLDSRSPQ